MKNVLIGLLVLFPSMLHAGALDDKQALSDSRLQDKRLWLKGNGDFWRAFGNPK